MGAYLPERYETLLAEGGGIRTFAGRELDVSDRVARHILRGGLAVLEGEWERVLRLHGTIRRKYQATAALHRLMVRAEGEWVVGVTPARRVPHLPMLMGVSDEGEYLIALEDFLGALQALEQPHYVEALGAGLVVHQNVLVPRSQPLIHLLRGALANVAPVLPARPRVLDMGCGSGVCALLAAQAMPGASVVAADHLPEAVATTRTNVERMGLLSQVTVADPGDLFDTLGDQRFDLIIFNAPWVVAPARNRAETALNDAGQQTLRRFLQGAAERLDGMGRVILGYADHSGPKALAHVEAFAAQTGLVLGQRHVDRIKTHRAQRAWQAIYAYEFAPAPAQCMPFRQLHTL